MGKVGYKPKKNPLRKPRPLVEIMSEIEVLIAKEKAKNEIKRSLLDKARKLRESGNETMALINTAVSEVMGEMIDKLDAKKVS